MLEAGLRPRHRLDRPGLEGTRCRHPARRRLACRRRRRGPRPGRRCGAPLRWAGHSHRSRSAGIVRHRRSAGLVVDPAFRWGVARSGRTRCRRPGRRRSAVRRAAAGGAGYRRNAAAPQRHHSHSRYGRLAASVRPRSGLAVRCSRRLAGPFEPGPGLDPARGSGADGGRVRRGRDRPRLRRAFLGRRALARRCGRGAGRGGAGATGPDCRTAQQRETSSVGGELAAADRGLRQGRPDRFLEPGRGALPGLVRRRGHRATRFAAGTRGAASGCGEADQGDDLDRASGRAASFELSDQRRRPGSLRGPRRRRDGCRRHGRRRRGPVHRRHRARGHSRSARRIPAPRGPRPARWWRRP